MATSGKNLSIIDNFQLKSPEKIKIGVVVAEWNKQITQRLLDGVTQTLHQLKIPNNNIQIHWVPGTFELPIGAQYVLEGNTKIDGIICVGCVIEGETKHFDYVCLGATNGIMNVGLRYNKPVTFCVLTDQNEQQSIERSGGKHGNKGVECTISCLKMIMLKKEINSSSNKIGF